MHLVVAIFAAVGLLSATAAVVSMAGQAEAPGFARQLAHSEFIWLLFASLSPLVLSIARRFPLTERGELGRKLGAHVATLLAMSLAHTVVYTTTMHLVGSGSGARILDVVGDSWFFNLRADVFVYALLVGGYYLYVGRTRGGAATADAPVPSVQSPVPRLDRLVVKDRGQITFVALDDIESLEAEGDYVRVRTNGKSHLARETLRSMEQSLDTGRFVRIHRSTIVNVARIARLEPHEHGEFFAVMSSGARLKVSRSYRPVVSLLSQNRTSPGNGVAAGAAVKSLSAFE
jgi:hypothetical protein